MTPIESYVSLMTRVLLVTKGHPFKKNEFFTMFDDLVADKESCVTEYTHVEQPAAQHLFHPDTAKNWDVFVMYDMPGIEFNRPSTEPSTSDPVKFHDPPEWYKNGSRSLLEEGKGMIFLHHAIAGWPTWEDWAHVIGGRFHYQPGTLAGVEYPDSGYRHNVTHSIEVVENGHPIVEGLPETFEFTDEVYLAPVLEGNVDPILRSNFSYESKNFYSADLAIRGKGDSNEGWEHPRTSNLVGWVKHAGNSPVAYLQFGDGPGQYAEPLFQKMISNAILWASAEKSHEWARQRREATGRFA